MTTPILSKVKQARAPGANPKHHKDTWRKARFARRAKLGESEPIREI